MDSVPFYCGYLGGRLSSNTSAGTPYCPKTRCRTIRTVLVSTSVFSQLCGRGRREGAMGDGAAGGFAVPPFGNGGEGRLKACGQAHYQIEICPGDCLFDRKRVSVPTLP